MVVIDIYRNDHHVEVVDVFILQPFLQPGTIAPLRTILLIEERVEDFDLVPTSLCSKLN